MNSRFFLVFGVMLLAFATSFASADYLQYNWKYSENNTDNVIFLAKANDNCVWHANDSWKTCNSIIEGLNANQLNLTVDALKFTIAPEPRGKNVYLYYSNQSTVYNETFYDTLNYSTNLTCLSDLDCDDVNESTTDYCLDEFCVYFYEVARNVSRRSFSNWVYLGDKYKTSFSSKNFAYKNVFDLPRYSTAHYDFSVSFKKQNGQEIPVILDPDIDACGTLGTAGATYVLNQSVSSTGTCFNVTAANVTLDCNNFGINYSSTTLGYGVYSNQFNTTIKNAAFINQTSVNGAYGVYYVGSSNGSVYNNVMSSVHPVTGNNDYEIYLSAGSNYNLISANNITTQQAGVHGLYVTDSIGNSFTLNNVTTNGAGSYGFYSLNSNNSLLISNRFNTTQSVAVYLGGNSKENYDQTFPTGTTQINYAEGLPIFFSYADIGSTLLENVSLNTYGQVVCAWCFNSTFKNVSMGADGFALYNSSGIRLTNSTANTANGLALIVQNGSSNNVSYSNFTTTGTQNLTAATIASSSNLMFQSNTVVATTIGVSLVSSNNAFIDCEGKQINYSSVTTGPAAMYGVYSVSVNTTVKNCVIKQTAAAASGHGISFVSNSSIIDNNVTTIGTSARPIITTGSSYSNVTGNLIVSTGSATHGIYVANGLYNDVENNTITSGTTSEGIYLVTLSNYNNVTNNTISCTGTNGFGVHLVGANYNLVNKNTIATWGTTGYGFNFGAATDNNVLDKNNVFTNKSVGVYSISGADYNNVTNNVFNSTGSTTIYFLASGGVTSITYWRFINNTLASTAGSSVLFTSNQYNNPVTSNTFENNNMSRGISIVTSVAGVYANSLNTFTNDTFTTFASEDNLTNSFTNCSFTSLTFTSFAQGNVFWYARLHTIDGTTSGDLAAVNVNMSNVNDTSIENFTTDINGYYNDSSTWFTILEYIENASGIFNYTPHWFNATKSGYTYNYTNFNISKSQVITIALTSSGSVEPPVVSWLYQLPITDITTTNLFSGTSNIELNETYNISIPLGLNGSTVQFFHKTNSTTSDVHYFMNGTAFSGFEQTELLRGNISNIWNFSVDENLVYKADYNFNSTYFYNATRYWYSLTSPNQYVKLRFFNISSTEQYSFFEFNARNASSNSGVLRVYYCNSSYVSGNPTANSNCAQFGTIVSNQTFNHTHSINSTHYILPMAISGGKLNGVSVTATSYFLLRGSNLGNWNVSYITNETRPDQMRVTTNAGAAWSSLSGTFDSHVHQYTGSDTFYHYVCANDSVGTQTCSGLQSDLLNLGGLPPTAPFVYYPVNSTYYGNVNITWTAAVSPNAYEIASYNVSLLYANETYYQTIAANTSPNLYYNWNSNTVANGEYIINVTACDVNGLCASGFSENFTVNNSFNSPQYSNRLINNTNSTQYDSNVASQASISWNGEDTVIFNWNGTNYTISGPPYVYYLGVLGVGNYSNYWCANNTAGVWNCTTIETFEVTLNTTNACYLALNGTQGDRSFNYGETVNATGWLIEGSGLLELNGSTYTNPLLIDLGGGYWFFNYSKTEDNYSACYVERYATINPVSSNANLLLNGTDGNKTVWIGDTSNATGYCLGLTPVLYRNTVVVSNPNIGNLAEGVYNYTVICVGNENYTSSWETHYLSVALFAPTIENLFRSDIIFEVFILLLSIVFIGIGLYLKNNTFIVIGAVGLLILALLIMSLGIEIQSGNQVLESVTDYPNVSVLGTCFNQTQYVYNETLNLTQTHNILTCPSSFNVTKSVQTATSASWVRLPRIWEMAITTILLLVSLYLLVMSFLGYINDRKTNQAS